MLNEPVIEVVDMDENILNTRIRGKRVERSNWFKGTLREGEIYRGLISQLILLLNYIKYLI